LLRATAPSWFPPGHLQAQEAKLGAFCPAPTLVHRPSCQWPCHQPIGPGGLLPVPPIYSWAPIYLTIQPKSVRRGLAPRNRLPPAQELCDLLQGADKPHMKSASLPQAAQQPAPKPRSIHLSAARDKRRTASDTMPCLAAGAKRRFLASSSPPPKAQGLGSQLPEARAPSGQASMATSTVPPKLVTRGPPEQSSQKPVPPKECGGKVPTITHQHHLSLFMDEGLKFCSSTQDATEKELKEEKAANHQSPSKKMDRDVAANTFHKMQGLEPGPGARGAALYQRLKEHLLTQAQLKENGYPFAHPKRPGGAVLFTTQEKPPQDASSRLCCRCGTQYLVASSGHCVHQVECHYHWGRLRPTPAAGGWEIQYTCCSAPIGSPGCQVAQQHVHDGRQQDLQGFVQTLDKELPPGAHPGIYALDCEMCYTTSGLELTRVSVVDSALQLVYDAFVRPDRDIVDYNTRFSGVTAADLAHTSTSIRDVQAALLTLFNAHTILIGHSLQSDLLALKLIHGTVLDTSVLFPHRRGLPYKRSLRNLTAHYLGHVIQDRIDGHSSSEDASACMRLVIWKMGQDAEMTPAHRLLLPGAPGDVCARAQLHSSISPPGEWCPP
uniref:Exonuclease domain-containing protein n=1 Tax=Myotis lucifugus TaxID=59463 RepID=G1Q3S3_MYOLU